MVTVTKAKKVENFFRSQISHGVWKPGTKLPEAEQLSEDLGVSFSTVMNVLAQLANDGLVDRVQKKGTFVSKMTQTANIVLLANADSVNAARSNFYRVFLHQAAQSIEIANYQPVLKAGLSGIPEKFLASIQFPQGLTAKETVGIISLAGMEKALATLGVPFVSVTGPFEVCPNGIVYDLGAMHEMAARVLLEHGYEDFSVTSFQIPADRPNSVMFKELRREQLEAVDGREDRLILCPHTPDCRYAYDAFKKYWLAGHRPRAVFFHDEVVFDVASRAILELGIKIPDELAILTQGVAGVHYHFPIPVTCLEFDAHQMATLAWEKLQGQILGQEMTGPIYVKPRLRDGKTL